MNIKLSIRKVLWRLLGVDYGHMLRVVDCVYLKEDSNTTMGHKSYCNNGVVFRWSDASIIIGNYCSIASGVRFIVDQGSHQTGVVTSYPFKANDNGHLKGITIGNDVWIGQNVTILPGVKIGSGVTIAAGSVVNKDIPDYCLAAGVPAKIVKRKCSEHEAEQMLEIAWWNWSDDKVETHHADFMMTIPEFINRHNID